MFTQKFWYDALERAIATFAQTFIAVSGLDSMSKDLQVSFQTVLVASAIAAGLSILKALAATRFGSPNTAAMLPEGPDTEAGYATPDLVVAVLCFVVGVILTKLFWC